MPGEAPRDPLSRWLDDEGRRTLDVLTGGALDVVAVVDRDLVIRYLNRTISSLSREEIVGGSAIELAPPDFRETARKAYASVFETGTGERFDSFYEVAGQVFMFDVRVGAVRVEGEIIGLNVVISDVTEQRRAHMDRDRFFSLSLDMLVVVSRKGELKRVNPAFCTALGFDVADLLGKPFMDLLHPDDRQRSKEGFDKVLSGRPVTDFENRYRRTDGEHRVFSWRATADPITGDVYAVARDVTDQRATEAQLRHAQKMEAIGQLAGGVAHDFNNLLQAIMANTDLAMFDAPASSGIADRLADIEGAARRAADLTKQLLAFSRRQPIRPVPVDLNRLTQGLMNMLRRLLPASIAIDFIPGHHLASVNADPTQLEQVLVNLCVNARDAMEKGGQLTIETENVLIDGRYTDSHPWATPGRYVLLSVTDTGAGMSAAVRERIFEPFFTTKDAQRGTGLGLSTVYGIVQQHEGLIHVYSELGQGTTVKVYLPAESRLAVDVGNKLELEAPRGHETVLVAEDEEAVRRAVVEILHRAGYRTLVATEGSEAIRLLSEHEGPVHLALLDMVMPELGGLETWEQLRRLRPDLRVLFLSGYADGRYLKAVPPNAEILGKPFRAQNLLRRIRKQLDQA